MSTRTHIVIQYGKNGQFVCDDIDEANIHENVISVEWTEDGLSRHFIVPMSEVKFVMMREIARQEEKGETVHE